MPDALHPCFALVAVAAPIDSTSIPLDGFVGVFGRLHPMVLHVPIGMLVALLLLEVLGAVRRHPLARDVRVTLAWLTALSAILAAGTGYVLALEPGYGTTTVDRHRLLGIAVAVGCTLVAVMAASDRLRVLRWLLLLATTALMVPTGHLGASTTHGEDFLWTPLRDAAATNSALRRGTRDLAALDITAQPESPAASGEIGDAPAPAPAGGAQATVSFDHDVLPILTRYCVDCHGASKAKGRLRLHTLAAVLDGGSDGPVVVPGNPDESELLRRVHLPVDDPDHMPPEDLDQPGAAQIDVIAEWIRAGAVGPGAPSRAAVPPAAPGQTPVAAPASGVAPARAGPTVAVPAPEANAAAVAALRSSLVHVERLSEGDNRLWVDFAGATALPDDAIAALLEPLRESIAELSLARTAVGARTMAVVARMPVLEKLDLRNTSAGTESFAGLRDSPRLSEILLVQAGLGDAAVETLVSMPALRRVHAWRSGIGPEALAALAARRTDVTVLAGDGSAAAALEREETVTLAREGAAPDAAKPPAGAPTNSACPVTGSPVDPRYVILHEGRAIGFCCPNCPKEFWANPGKYAGAK